MLGHRGTANAKTFGKVSNRALPLDQLTNDEQAVTIGERLEQIGGPISRKFQGLYIYLHSCEYMEYRIYSQH